jgi:hypothetical protein
MISFPNPSHLQNAVPLAFPNHTKPFPLQMKSVFHHSYDTESKTHGNFSTENDHHQEKSRRSGGSVSRPIAISSVEAKRRAQEMEDLLRAEIWYRNVTWQLHARILEYREKHPLPEAYFARQESNNEREGASDWMEYNESWTDEGDEEDETPFMIFDLDIEDEGLPE